VGALLFTNTLYLSAVETDTQWLMQLRSRGCWMQLWRRTSSLGAHL